MHSNCHLLFHRCCRQLGAGETSLAAAASKLGASLITYPSQVVRWVPRWLIGLAAKGSRAGQNLAAWPQAEVGFVLLSHIGPPLPPAKGRAAAITNTTNSHAKTTLVQPLHKGPITYTSSSKTAHVLKNKSESHPIFLAAVGLLPNQ